MKGRATQLDGLRAVSMLAICWDHWCPHGWPRVFPFEIFLFFFLVMTGYFITGSLLRERDRSEAKGAPWKWQALKTYQIRRGLRILAPYYAALALALLVMAPDVWHGFGWYFFHLSNIHMASLGYWPPGTNHFWSLAMQQQFYLVWPFVIWFLPRRALVWVALLFTACGPVARCLHDPLTHWVPWPQVLTWASFDYFGIGALFAMAVHRGMSLESPALRWAAWTGFAAYLAIYISHSSGLPTHGLRAVQQTFLSVALCGVIAGGTVGLPGVLGRVLEHASLQWTGRVSYGIYLYHNLAPLLAGKMFWFLWGEAFQSPFWELFKVGVFAALTWGLTIASWRWIEEPLQGVRSRMGNR